MFSTRLLREHRSAVSTGGVAVAGFALVAAILTAPGFPINSVTMHDGSVWVTKTDEGKIGRLNRQIDELDAAVYWDPGAGVDVLQSGNAVLVTDETGSAALVNTATASLGTPVKGPEGAEYALGGEQLAVLDPSGGDGWVLPAAELGALDFEETPPTVNLGPGGSVVVGDDGAAHFLSLSDDALLSVAPDGATQRAELGAEVAEDAQLTAVGSSAVVLTGDRLLVVDGGVDEHTAPDLGGALLLQQPGPDASTVLVAGSEGLTAVALSDGAATPAVEGVAGTPIAPVLVAGCAHAAWSGDQATYARSCGDADPVTAPLPDATDQGVLRFRVNRTVVALNDTGAGFAWVMDETGEVERTDDWEPFQPEPEGNEESEEVAEQLAEPKQEPQCSVPNLNPIAEDDEFGVRQGLPAVLPVTANDKDPDTCDVVAVTTVSELTDEQGRLDIVAAGSSLQFTPNPDFRGSVTATYTLTDGRGGSDTATVTITVVAGGNRAPVELRPSTTTVEAGEQVSYNVLADWSDPDGDALLLTAASSAQAVLRWSSDGAITVVDPGQTPGRVLISFVVTDGTDTAQGTLRVDVQPVGAPIPPVALGDYAVGVVGRPITVRPLLNDTDANGDVLRLVSVSEAAGAVVSFDSSTGTVVLTPERPGTFVLSYGVSDGGEPVAGTIRIDVRAVGEGSPPVAVLDKAQVVPGGAPALVDVLANDVDADGDPLAVLSAQAPEGSGITVSVVDFARLRIVARQVHDTPVAVSYRITDGLSQATGTVLVSAPASRDDADQPPIARPDRASVRAGDVVNIPVLANDNDPEQGPLTLSTDLVEPPAEGLLFASGDMLRFVAPDEPGNHTAVYQISDRADNAATARVDLTVLPADAEANRPPQPQPITARVVAGSAVVIAVPLAGIDPDGDSAFLAAVASSPAIGALEPLVPGATAFEYRTPTDQTDGGVDEFRYRVSDRFGAEAVGVVSVVILPRQANQAPITIDDVAIVQPGRTVNVPVLANDADPDGDALTLAGTSNAEGVSFGLETITVEVPDEDGASLNVPYIADDGRGGTTPGLLSITASATAPTQPPVAVDDAAGEVAAEATEVTVDVLANDSDPDGTRDELSVSLPNRADGSVSGGEVTIALQDDPRLVPYQVQDPDGNVAYAVVSVPGSTVARFPVLRPGALIEATIGETTTVSLPEVVEDPLGQELSLGEDLVVTPGAGQAAVRDGQSFTFTPSPEASAEAKVAVTVRTEDGRSSLVDIPVRIASPANRPPVTTDAGLTVPAGEEARLPLQRYASDPDAGDELTFSNAQAEGTGLDAVTINGAELVVEAGVGAELGPVNVSYRVSDGTDEVGGTVLVTVVQTNRPEPRAIPESGLAADQGRATTLEVLRSDFNPFADRGEPLQIVGAQVAASSGQVSHDGRTVTFTSAADFFGAARITYQIRDAADRTSVGEEVVSVSGPPAAPGTPRLDRTESRQITLSWAAPATNNGAAITGYRVESDSGVAKSCPATTCVVDGLTNGTEYRFRVLATNARGDGPFSDWSQPATPDQVPDAPAAPAVQFGDRQLTVSWKAPSNGGTAITDYLVRWNGQSKSVGNALTATLGNLSNGTAYDVSVTAVNAAGESQPSPATRETPAAAPAAPQVAQPTLVEGQSGSTLRVAWTPGADGGAALYRRRRHPV